MMSFAAKHGFFLACIRALMDMGCIALGYLLAVLCQSTTGSSTRETLLEMWPYLAAYVVVWALVADQQLFHTRRSESLVSLLFSLVRAYITTFFFTAFLLSLFLSPDFDRLFFLLLTIFALVTLLSFRLTLGLSLSKLRRLGFSTQRIIIIGANERAAHLVQIFHANEQYGYHIEGFLEDNPERRRILERHGLSYLGRVDDLEQLLLERVIDRIYVALPVRSQYEVVRSITNLCEGIGVPVRFIADFFPLGVLTPNLNSLKDIPLLSLTYEPEFQTRYVLRRMADQLSACILLLFLSPLFFIIALLIKLESGGPVFCRCWSEKQNGAMFQLIRFQVLKEPVMLLHGEEVALSEVPIPGIKQPNNATNRYEEAELSAENLTRIGRWIRRNGLEDLPQLLNVMQGHIVLSGSHRWRSHRATQKTNSDKEAAKQLGAEFTG